MFATLAVLQRHCALVVGILLLACVGLTTSASAFEDRVPPQKVGTDVLSDQASPRPSQPSRPERRVTAFERGKTDDGANHSFRSGVSSLAVLPETTVNFPFADREQWQPVDFIAEDQWIPAGEPPPKWFEIYRANDGDSSSQRYAPWGNGHIVITDPAEYPRIPDLDNDDPSSIFSTYRANLFGQEVSDEWDFYNLINTDRPDFTDATYSVGKGVTIIESGYTVRSIVDHEANNRVTRRSLPEVLVRYGLTDEFELRMKWNGYVLSDLVDRSSGARTQFFGGDDLLLSFKYEVKQQDGWSPMVTLLSGATIPTGTNGVSSNAVQPFVNVVGGWGIRRWLYLKVSGGVDWQRSSVSTLLGGGSVPQAPAFVVLRDHLNLYHGSASLLYQATKRVGGFIEFFSLATTGASDNRPANYVDTGLFIYINPNVQLDVRVGDRLGSTVSEIFTGAGFSVRF